ncbi:MAG: VWA domain-containing protein [Rhizobiaceae bacterium]|nr:VWA domain-containing protein [Rhizobiaceae bacterium]
MNKNNFLPKAVQKFKDFKKCKKGNFALLTAVLSPVVLVSGSLALDVANMSALKGSLQAAVDSVSLTVATRIANGELSLDDAETFGSTLLIAQMSNVDDRFLNLQVTPTVNVIENVTGSNQKSWNIEIGGTASQDTTPLATFFGKDQMSVFTSSTATTATEEEIGAFSMAVVVDVSGSMSSNIGGSTTDVEAALSVSSSQAGVIVSYIGTVTNTYGLTEENIIYILENYTTSDCDNFYYGSGDKNAFLQAINKPTSDSYYKAYLYCAYPTYAATYYGTTATALIANISTVLESSPTSKIDALKSAAASLFAQFDEADPSKQYVRTGIISYSSSIQGYRDMEWGTASATSFATTLSANGGTASTDAVKWGYDKLKTANTTEATEHMNKNGQVPERFILFMTDGNNNYSSDDTSTKSYCDQAKADGIKIYSVAFAAPSGGQALLEYCASEPTADYYFEPETASELIAAFTNIGAETSKSATRLIN